MFFHYHPYKPYINIDTKIIIVGTLPPPRFCTKELKNSDVDFCYGSKDNLLWQIFNKVFSLNLLFENTKQAIEQRKIFLKGSKIGICDIVESCNREKFDASDNSMLNIKLRDILKYLLEYKNIDTIFFTGKYSKNSPEYFFRKVLKEQEIDFILIKNDYLRVHKFVFDNRVFTTISLISPSNTANKSIGAKLIYKNRKLMDKAYTTFDFRVDEYKRAITFKS
ncbi:uracil-DNA glycosylase family protein [Aliarcobacter lanthieri]|uniref:uracil-DNA glycosylase family protein n=1 Tax=Aliarcobacter lanthieri TaxID=1355374 RepID=UPI003AADECCA